MAPYVNLNTEPGSAGADVTPLTDAGVPGASLVLAADGVGSYPIIFIVFGKITKQNK